MRILRPKQRPVLRSTSYDDRKPMTHTIGSHTARGTTTTSPATSPRSTKEIAGTDDADVVVKIHLHR